MKISTIKDYRMKSQIKILKYSEETGDIEEFNVEVQEIEVERCDCERSGYNIHIENCKIHNPVFQR
jgi:hypothetical protein